MEERLMGSTTFFYSIYHLYFAFQSFDFECTWCRLFQKRVMYTKLDIYVFLWQHSSSTKKPDCHNITEILLKVALNTIPLDYIPYICIDPAHFCLFTSGKLIWFDGFHRMEINTTSDYWLRLSLKCITIYD